MDSCSLIFDFDGRDIYYVYYTNEEPLEEFAKAYFTRLSAFFRLEPTDEALKEMYLERFPDSFPALGWSVTLDDMRSKGYWDGDFTTKIEGENTKLWI